jgi:hypothetical protein
MPSIAPASHTRRRGLTTDSWITPEWLINRLGQFDLDPCASIPQPWPCARRQYTVRDDGLTKPWRGFVYCNPPYGRLAASWLEKMRRHNNGIALVFARTDTRMFFDHVWPSAVSLLFIRGRLTFAKPNGKLPKKGHNSGGPSVLIAYGEQARERLEGVSDLGFLVETEPSW